LAKLVNGRPLKAISHYWRSKIAGYQSTLNRCGSKTSRRLKAMYSRWRSHVKSYVDSKVRQTIEWLHEAGVSIVKVGYPRYIAQENGNFNNVQVWTYRYLLRRFKEVAEEYGMTTVYVGEAYSSTTCPVHRDRKCVKRVKRGLLKCTRLNKVFNVDLVGAYNILATPITPSPEKGRGNGPKARPGATSPVAPNLPALTGGNPRPLGRGGGQEDLHNIAIAYGFALRADNDVDYAIVQIDKVTLRYTNYTYSSLGWRSLMVEFRIYIDVGSTPPPCSKYCPYHREDASG